MVRWLVALTFVAGCSVVNSPADPVEGTTTTSTQSTGGTDNTGGAGATGGAGMGGAGMGGDGMGGMGAAGGGGSGPTIIQGAQATDFVGSGQRAESAQYRMIFTLGESSPYTGVGTTSQYRLQGGLVGATEDTQAP